MTETLREIALSATEVQEILAQCGSSALLVGGQALALWAVYFDVEPVGVLSGKITSDADFIGNAQLAGKLSRALNWDLWRPKFDDATPQTAKLTRAVKGGIQQIDFLSGIIGLDTRAIQTRAVEITLWSAAGAVGTDAADLLAAIVVQPVGSGGGGSAVRLGRNAQLCPRRSGP